MKSGVLMKSSACPFDLKLYYKYEKCNYDWRSVSNPDIEMTEFDGHVLREKTFLFLDIGALCEMQMQSQSNKTMTKMAFNYC